MMSLASTAASVPVTRASGARPRAQRNAGNGPAPKVPSARVAAAAAVFGARRASAMSTSRGTFVAARASAAAGGAGSDADPWKALGVPQGADADAIKKALDRKKLLYKSEPEKLAAMETAYESIVQASLQARLRGDVSSVDSRVLKADTVPLFGPWAPIPSEAPLKDKKVNVAISVAAFFVTLFTPGQIRTLQPIIYATIFHVFRMFMKLVDVDPGPSANIDKDAAVRHNNKRFFRSFALVIGTFAVTLGLTYYVPNIIFEMFKVKVPVWYLLNQEVFVTGVVATALAYLTCFYR
jgi:hypothetical protein